MIIFYNYILDIIIKYFNIIYNRFFNEKYNY